MEDVYNTTAYKNYTTAKDLWIFPLICKRIINKQFDIIICDKSMDGKSFKMNSFRK